MYTSITPPANWLVCDGSAISRTTYSALFGLIGTTYGAGDFTTTFNIPDMRQRMPYGYQTITNVLGTLGGSASTTLSTVNLPSHSHPLSSANAPITLTNASNKWGQSGVGSANFLNSSTNPIRVATTSATISGNTDDTGSGTAFTTISPYISINFIIKVL